MQRPEGKREKMESALSRLFGMRGTEKAKGELRKDMTSVVRISQIVKDLPCMQIRNREIKNFFKALSYVRDIRQINIEYNAR